MTIAQAARDARTLATALQLLVEECAYLNPGLALKLALTVQFRVAEATSIAELLEADQSRHLESLAATIMAATLSVEQARNAEGVLLKASVIGEHAESALASAHILIDQASCAHLESDRAVIAPEAPNG